MSQTMANSVPAIQKAMKQMDKMGLGKNVAEFEKVFEDMDVKVGEIDGALDGIYEGAVDQTAVNALL